MLYEIRNYHFRPDLLGAYEAWASGLAIPYLSKHVDVAGFWINTDDAPEVSGQPQDGLGVANVTWIIRWRDLADRAEGWPRATSGAEWEAILAQVPGGVSSYLRIEAKFARSLIQPPGA